MTLIERNEQILARAANLSPLEPQLRELFSRGKREQLLAGADAQGAPFAPLAPSTLRQKSRGPGGPLVPRGASSSIITGYFLTFAFGPNMIRVSAGWPGLDWVGYHITGTRRMPRRDPSGFRPRDLAEGLALMREHIFGRYA